MSWQLHETVKFRVASELSGCSGCCGGTPLQWFLLALMLLSVLEGVLMTLVDLVLLARHDGSLTGAELQEELSLTLMIGHVDHLIVSLMIIGLGVDGWRRGARYAKAAVALGLGAALSRRLPAPLVLVGGVSCLQRATKPGAPPEHESGGSGWCTLRCALRPLLAVAVLEAIYSSIPPSQLEEGMQQIKRDGTLRPMLEAAGPDADEAMMLLDSMRPEQVLDAAQQALGELVQFGVVLALGISGHAHGLRHTRLPIAAAFVPGLPVSFAVVFYFLLETRHAQGGGTLLPLHGCAQDAHAN